MSTKLTKVQFNLQSQSHLTCFYNNCISAGQVLKIKPTIIVGFIFMTWPALIPNTRTKPLRSLGYHFTFNFNLTSLDFIKKSSTCQLYFKDLACTDTTAFKKFIAGIN